MIPLYSSKQVRKLDDYAINKLGLSGIVLMENASREIFQSITENFEITSIAIICGKGNNGGDGFAVARHFVNAGYKTRVIHLGAKNDLSDDAAVNFSVLKKMQPSHPNLSLEKYNSVKSLTSLHNYDLICDALLGSGAKEKLREPYLTIVKKLNKIEKFKVAIDIPTGLDVDSGYGEIVFRADATITLGEYKKGLFFGDGYANSGYILKGRIGISDIFSTKFKTNEYLIEPEDAISGLPFKRKNIHKYSAGKVLSICGSSSFPGAAVLASKSALKIGAGASVLTFPASSRNLIQKKLGEVVVDTYEDNANGYVSTENIKSLKSRILWANTIAIGSGIGRAEGTQEFIIKLLKTHTLKKLVIDADGIYALNRTVYKKLNLKNVVFTPHHSEFANLIGISIDSLKKDILKYGYGFCKKTGAYLVLKGAPTIIFTPGGDALLNSTGNPALAKFGTGDVLTGIIAGLMAQQDRIENALVSGVYLHGLAADLQVAKKTEYSLLASDIIDYLPNAITFLRKSIV
jgi:NAD(P)H-hydrate epimerase